MSDKPILRPLDFQPVSHMGQQMWLLRDPLQLSSQQLIVPQGMAQMLMFLDGNLTRQQIHDAFCQLVGEQLDFEIVDNALNQLDEAFLLDNPRSQEARLSLLAAYRAQPHRHPALADLSYPADPVNGSPSNPIHLRVTDTFGASSVASTTLTIYDPATTFEVLDNGVMIRATAGCPTKVKEIQTYATEKIASGEFFQKATAETAANAG